MPPLGFLIKETQIEDEVSPAQDTNLNSHWNELYGSNDGCDDVITEGKRRINERGKERGRETHFKHINIIWACALAQLVVNRATLKIVGRSVRWLLLRNCSKLCHLCVKDNSLCHKNNTLRITRSILGLEAKQLKLKM